jgi:hypothetical protein
LQLKEPLEEKSVAALGVFGFLLKTAFVAAAQ